MASLKSLGWRRASTDRYDVHINDLLPDRTITVRTVGMHWFKLRLQLGLVFIAIGTWIANFQLCIECDGDEQ